MCGMQGHLVSGGRQWTVGEQEDWHDSEHRARSLAGANFLGHRKWGLVHVVEEEAGTAKWSLWPKFSFLGVGLVSGRFSLCHVSRCLTFHSPFFFFSWSLSTFAFFSVPNCLFQACAGHWTWVTRMCDSPRGRHAASDWGTLFYFLKKNTGGFYLLVSWQSSSFPYCVYLAWLYPSLPLPGLSWPFLLGLKAFRPVTPVHLKVFFFLTECLGFFLTCHSFRNIVPRGSFGNAFGKK